MDTTFFNNLKLKDGDVLNVPAGKDYQINAPIEITGQNIIIQKSGSGSDPTITFKGADGAAAFHITATASHVTIIGLKFIGLGTKNYGVDAAGSNVTVRKCGVTKGGGLMLAHAVNGLLVEDCYADVSTDRNFIYANIVGSGTSVKKNKNITIRRCRNRGSVYEDSVVVHGCDGLVIDSCNFDNAAAPAQDKVSLRLCDGTDFTIKNTINRGRASFGPTGGATGGLYDDPGAERDRKLALRLTNLTITGSTFTNKVNLEAGIVNLNWDHVCQRSTLDGVCLDIADKYGPRDIPQGTISNTQFKWTGIGTGSLNDGDRSKIKFIKCTFNGKPITDPVKDPPPPDPTDPLDPIDPNLKQVPVGPSRAVKNLKAIQDNTEYTIDDGVTVDIAHATVKGKVIIKSNPADPATIHFPDEWASSMPLPPGPDCQPFKGRATIMVSGTCILKNVHTSGGEKVIVFGTLNQDNTQTADITAENITMDGGGIIRASGAKSIKILKVGSTGKPYAYYAASFTYTVKKCVIDNTGVSTTIKQGGHVNSGQDQGETTIRIMDCDDLTITGCTTEAWLHDGTHVWKQEVQLRPDTKKCVVKNCHFNLVDIGDMTWRHPAHTIDYVEFIDCTLDQEPHITNGARIVKYTNTMVHGSLRNRTDSFHGT